MIDPAPEMTRSGYCSACHVLAIRAGDDQYKICPKCFAMLDHNDLTLAEQQRKEAAAVAHRAVMLARRAAREAVHIAEHEAAIKDAAKKISKRK